MTMRKTFPLALLLAALLLPVLVGAAPEPRPVAVRELGTVAVFPQRSAPATVVSLNDSLLSAEIRARISGIPVLVGQEVRQGDTLVEFACRDYRIALRAAEAARELATTREERARILRDQQAVPQEHHDQRRAELAAATAVHDRAGLDVERCRLTAPFSGVVLARLANEGEYADIGAPLLRLLATDQLEVTAQIPLEEALSLQDAAALYFAAAGRQWPLTLRRLVPVVNPEARNSEARLLFAAAAALPGSAGRLLWQSSQPHLPADLVVRRNEGLGVFLAVEGRARFLLLPEAREGHPAAVDLPPTTLVVSEGRHGLRDGDPIRIVNSHP